MTKQVKLKKRISQFDKQKSKIIQPVLEKYISKEFLTANSLFDNLISSQQFKIDISQNQFLNLIFGTRVLLEKDLFQFCYSHRYQKKMILYSFLKVFLESTQKTELLMMLNNQKMDDQELKKYLGDKTWGQYLKRIIIYTNVELDVFTFNLNWLPCLMSQRQFLKAIIISDINSFDTNFKLTNQKYYNQLSRDLFILSFKKDQYQFKIMQKNQFSYYVTSSQQLDKVDDKVCKYLRKKYEYSYNPSMILPLQNARLKLKGFQQTYKSVLLRKSVNNDSIQEVVFSSRPFKLESVKQL